MFYWDKPAQYGIDKETSDLFLAYEKALASVASASEQLQHLDQAEPVYAKLLVKYKVKFDEALALRKQFLTHIS